MLHRLFTQGLAINTYLVIDPSTNKAAVIDPTRDIKELLALIDEKQAIVTAILETHVHADFVSGAKELKKALGGLPLICCSAEPDQKNIPKYADLPIHDRDDVMVGRLRFQAWHTPGHTPEHIMWVLYNENENHQEPLIAFTGDLLFVGSIGRPDLLGESHLSTLSHQLYHSIQNVLAELPDDVEIFPGHGAGSACGKHIGTAPCSLLGLERKDNPYLTSMPEQTWIEKAMSDLPLAPAYFSDLKKINLEGMPYNEETPPLQELTYEQMMKIQAQDPNLLIIDVRSKEEFAEGHLPGSLNIPLGPPFMSWLPIMAYNKKFVLIGRVSCCIEKAKDGMHVVGIDSAEGYVFWKNIVDAKVPLESFPIITSDELIKKMEEKPDAIHVIDVRTNVEWNAGHIENAHHVILNQLMDRVGELDKTKEIAITCRTGYRASLAASLLQRAGFTKVSSIKGGMQDWMDAMLPTIKSAQQEGNYAN